MSSNIFKNYHENVVKYDLVNKFNYKNIKQLPKLKSITLTFKLKTHNVKELISSLAAIKIISYQHPSLTLSKVSNVSFNVRKGQPVGCKVTLRKKKLRLFLNLIINNTPVIKKKINYKNNFLFSFKISNILIFNKLEKNYQFFKNLSDLNINIHTINCKNNELFFLMQSHKLII